MKCPSFWMSVLFSFQLRHGLNLCTSQLILTARNAAGSLSEPPRQWINTQLSVNRGIHLLTQVLTSLRREALTILG